MTADAFASRKRRVAGIRSQYGFARECSGVEGDWTCEVGRLAWLPVSGWLWSVHVPATPTTAAAVSWARLVARRPARWPPRRLERAARTARRSEAAEPPAARR